MAPKHDDDAVDTPRPRWVAWLIVVVMATVMAGMLNIGNPDEFTINELLDMVLELVPTTGKVVNAPLPQDDPRRRRPDITRARDVLGWSPRVSLSEGLPMTAEWFAEEVGAEVSLREAAE